MDFGCDGIDIVFCYGFGVGYGNLADLLMEVLVFFVCVLGILCVDGLFLILFVDFVYVILIYD